MYIKILLPGCTQISIYFFFLFPPVDLSPAALVELVARVRSTRLKLVMADAIFRSLCCRSGFPVGDEPLSLKKMVCVYSLFIAFYILFE